MTERSTTWLSPSLAIGWGVYVFGGVMACFHLGYPLLAVGGYFAAFAFCYLARSSWLVIVPTAIVAGHSYPISGSLLVSPGDLVVVAAVASVLFRLRSLKTDRGLFGLLMVLVGIAGIGAVRGWLALPESRLSNQLDLYLSQLNSLYMFKGYVLGALLGFAFLAEWQASPGLAWRRLSLGVQLSALVVSLLVIAERSLAFGVFDFENQFRASGPIFSMHIGGQHIDCFWVLVLPFLLFGNTPRDLHPPSGRVERQRGEGNRYDESALSSGVEPASPSLALPARSSRPSPALRGRLSRRESEVRGDDTNARRENRTPMAVALANAVFLVVTQVLSIYAIFATMSRSTIVLAAFMVLVAIAVHGFTWLRHRSSPERGSHRKRSSAEGFIALGGIVLLLLLAGMWFLGGAVGDRFASLGKDWDTRAAHAKEVGELASTINPILGQGLGTYPAAYREYHGQSESALRVHPVSSDDPHGGVLIQPGSRVYLEQRVDVERPSPWHVRLQYSVDNASAEPSPTEESGLRVMVCEKSLMQSFKCVSVSGREVASSMKTMPEHGMVQVDFDLDVSGLDARRPTALAVVASGDQSVRMRSIEVVDATGVAVLRNGDFRQGTEYWFFTGDDHLVWRAKNAWLHLRVELGWSGVIGWIALIGFVAWRLIQQWRVERFWVGGVMLMCWIPLSFTGTLVDTPWILQLLMLLLVGVAAKDGGEEAEEEGI